MYQGLGQRRARGQRSSVQVSGSTRSVVERARRAGIGARAAAVTVAVVLGASPMLAQGWSWPWDAPQPKPVPREPVYRGPAQTLPPADAPYGQQPAFAPRKNTICLQLEQRLVQESQHGNQSQQLIPMVESEQRQVDQQYRQAQAQLDRANCYEFFLFTKTLRNTRKCHDLAGQVNGLRQRLADLDTQRQQLSASSGQSYQDEIVRELARNNCGAAYEEQARKSDSFNPFASLWSEGESSGGGGGIGTYKSLPFATYRTLCVRLCDGYYFPVSFSTLPNHFDRDAEACQSKCAAPTELYYHQNPGGGVDQMLGFRSNTPYSELKSAFRYRKEFVAGCSCKEAEFLPESGAPQKTGEAAPQGAEPAEAATAPGAVPQAPAAEQPPPARRAEGPGEQLPWAPR